MNKLIALLSLIMLTSSCSVMSSQRLPPETIKAEISGAYYYLPKGKINIQVLRAEGTPPIYSIQYVKTSYVPDENELQSLKYHESASSDDKIIIHITKEGLLRSIESDTEDQSGKILIKLAEIAKEAVKASAAPRGIAGAPTVVYDVDFYPADIQQVNENLAKITQGQLQIQLRPSSVATKASTISSENISEGVCFRALRSYELISFKRDQGSNDYVVTEQRTIFLPDGSPRLCTPITRAAFVKKVTKLTFDNGVLTDVELNKPSQTLAFIDIPLAVVKAILALPTELIQLKIDYSNKDKALLDAQKGELEARQALLDLRKKYSENDDDIDATNQWGD